jgi:hypothetical protein
MVATYIIEYTLFHTHGLLLLYLVREETVDTANLVSLAISTGGGQTLVRLPLFVVYLVFLAHIVQGLRDSVRQDADTDPPSSAVKPASR